MEFGTKDMWVSDLIPHLRALPHLRTLRILQCTGGVDDELLREVAALSSLRLVGFLPDASAALRFVLAAHSRYFPPSYAGWMALHASRPELSVELILPRRIEDWMRLSRLVFPTRSTDLSNILRRQFEHQFDDVQQWRTLPHVNVSDLSFDAPCCE